MIRTLARWLHVPGVRVEGWNRASEDNADLAEAHGGWKPGNASRYSRFHLGDVFNIFPKMVKAPEPAAPGSMMDTVPCVP